MQIITYGENLKDQVINFMQKIWLELGRTWEINGREKDFYNIPQEYQTAGGEFWVVLNDENEVAGTVALKSLNVTECELGRLYLDPNYRGKGIGRDLIQLAVKQAKKSGFNKIKLDTSKKLTQAYNLFRKTGFKEVKENFDDERSVLMELNLTEE